MLLRITDNCSPTENLTVAQNPPAGDLLAPGSYTVIITASDPAGNQTAKR